MSIIFYETTHTHISDFSRGKRTNLYMNKVFKIFRFVYLIYLSIYLIFDWDIESKTLFLDNRKI